LGEEILVLEGVFSDETGDYPAGTYLMNPPGSSHAPFSKTGCTLFVKLRHLGPDQVVREVIDTKTAQWYQGMVPGLHVMPLMQQGSGSTLVRWAPQTYFNPHKHYGGEEIFVVDGVFEDEHGRYPAGSWIRSPHMSLHQPFSKEGCTIFVKTGHLIDLFKDKHPYPKEKGANYCSPYFLKNQEKLKTTNIFLTYFYSYWNSSDIADCCTKAIFVILLN
jgi:anti-sigma factor ChrR (cupin superfamily)